MKGLDKFQKYLVTGFNAFLLTRGSCDSDAKSQKREKQLNSYSQKMGELERLICTLLQMFNDQYASGNLDNISKFTALRLTLTKMTLRYLALMINYSKNTGSASDEKFLVASLDFLRYERDNKTINLVNTMINVDLSANFDQTAKNYRGSDLINKLSIKMIMVLITEKSFSQ